MGRTENRRSGAEIEAKKISDQQEELSAYIHQSVLRRHRGLKSFARGERSIHEYQESNGSLGLDAFGFLTEALEELPVFPRDGEEEDDRSSSVFLAFFPDMNAEVVHCVSESYDDQGDELVCNVDSYCLEAGTTLNAALLVLNQSLGAHWIPGSYFLGQESDATRSAEPTLGSEKGPRIAHLSREFVALSIFRNFLYRLSGSPAQLDATGSHDVAASQPAVALALLDMGIRPSRTNIPHPSNNGYKEPDLALSAPREVRCLTDVLYLTTTTFGVRTFSRRQKSSVRRCPICGRYFFAQDAGEVYCCFPDWLHRRNGKTCCEDYARLLNEKRKPCQNLLTRTRKQLENKQPKNPDSKAKNEKSLLTSFEEDYAAYVELTKHSLSRYKERIKWIKQWKREHGVGAATKGDGRGIS